MTRFHPPIASPRMNSSLALGTVTFDVEALASENEDEKLRLAKLNIEGACPLNKGSANTPPSIRHTRDAAEAGHLVVEKILTTRHEATLAEQEAREQLLRCSPLSLAHSLSCSLVLARWCCSC